MSMSSLWRPARIAGAVLTLAALLCAGCSDAPRAQVSEGAPYTGPRLTFETMNGFHVAVFEAPTGGWSVKRDSVRTRFDGPQVFITLRRPDGSGVATQALVAHHVDTGVAAGQEVTVYARVLERHASSDDAPYHLAGRAGGA